MADVAAQAGAAPAPGTGDRRGLPAAAWVVPPALVVAALFAYPLALIIQQAFTDADGLASAAPILDVLASHAFLGALFNTLEIALASTLGCLLLGSVLSVIFSFVPFPGVAFAARLIDTYIALPTFLVTLAFTFLYGSAGLLNAGLMQAMHLDLPPIHFLYSAWGVILAETTVYTPFVMRPLMAAFSLLDRSQVEVASSLGARPSYVLRRVIIPAALPALLAGGSLCLLLTVNEFGIVLFIGAKGVITLPLLIYDKAIQESDYSAACGIAMINIALSLALFALYRLVVARIGNTHAAVV
ncbi:2-aminoethylphosphonate ABC transporter permease subunit [Labrys monachus]|uniref:2-aminoethylphosphonate transport system permease protein n=1 Tax=Labrys monachus TaxID=217067 RepID=A0ABU0FB51_9HYPH|nr:2-aminoethylphosphonate ABC transporter permease subunit [Labrys monachus]MDQ0391840.1 2-aminoethylphosphonate transport system permease protein [Labrys monachus]